MRYITLTSTLNDAPIGHVHSAVSCVSNPLQCSRFSHGQHCPEQHYHNRSLPVSTSAGSLRISRTPLTAQNSLEDFQDSSSSTLFSTSICLNTLRLNSLRCVAPPVLGPSMLCVVERPESRAGYLAGPLPPVSACVKHSEILLNAPCFAIFPIASPGSKSLPLLCFEVRAIEFGESGDRIYTLLAPTSPAISIRSHLSSAPIESFLPTQIFAFSAYHCDIYLFKVVLDSSVSTMTLPADHSYDLQSILLVDDTVLSPTFNATLSTFASFKPSRQVPIDVTKAVDDLETTKQISKKVHVNSDIKIHTPRPYSHARPLPTRTPISDFASAAIDKHSQARDWAIHTCIPVVRPDGPSCLAFCSQCRLVVPLSPRLPVSTPYAIADIPKVEKRVSNDSNCTTSSGSTNTYDEHLIASEDSHEEPTKHFKIYEQSLISPHSSETNSRSSDPVPSSGWRRAFRWPTFYANQATYDGSKTRSCFLSYPIQKLLTQMAHRRYVVPLYPWKWRRPAFCGL